MDVYVWRGQKEMRKKKERKERRMGEKKSRRNKQINK
jgi:hypothetical protein